MHAKGRMVIGRAQMRVCVLAIPQQLTLVRIRVCVSVLTAPKFRVLFLVIIDTTFLGIARRPRGASVVWDGACAVTSARTAVNIVMGFGPLPFALHSSAKSLTGHSIDRSHRLTAGQAVSNHHHRRALASVVIGECHARHACTCVDRPTDRHAVESTGSQRKAATLLASSALTTCVPLGG